MFSVIIFFCMHHGEPCAVTQRRMDGCPWTVVSEIQPRKPGTLRFICRKMPAWGPRS